MVGEGLKDAYYSLEDKWFAFTEKIPGVSNAVDSLEDKGIPTFPAFIILIIIIIALLFWLVSFSSGAPLSVLINDQDGNPIDGASVTVFFDGDEVGYLQTNSEGKATFILASETYDVKVEKSGYGTITSAVETGEEEELTLRLDDVSITKAVSLKTATGQTVTGNGSVTYSCVGETSTKTALYTNGQFTADFADCTSITIISVSGHTVITGGISFSGTENVVVDELAENTGDVTVVLNSTDLIDGLKIDLMGEDGIPQKTAVNTGATVVFNDVTTKNYYVVVTDSTGNFKSYNGKGLGEIKELTKDNSITFNITLEKSTNSTIAITVKDTSGLPVSGVQVKLALASTLTTVETLTTAMSGQVTFNVADAENYVISAEHPNYLVRGGEAVSSGETKIITLIEANEENSRTITVITKDPTFDPVSNVRVTLKKMDGTIIDEKNTGADGKAIFYNLEMGQYHAYAIKDGFGGETSQPITLLPREANELVITMDIGKGTIKLTVTDNTFNTLRGVGVKAINYFTGNQEAVDSTNEEGVVTFDIRADKKVYFVLTSSGLADYYTIATYPDEGSTILMDKTMTPATGKMEIKRPVLTSGDSVVNPTTGEVSEGVYTALLLVEIPKGTFSEAGVHLRTGNSSNNAVNIMEEDPAHIGEVYTSAKKILKGTTYSPPNGYSSDTQNLTAGNAKWIESVWKNPKEGIYEVAADITITEINPNIGIDLWYRAWAKGSSILKDPSNTSDGHELYSSAKNYLLSSGAANLCGEVFCKSYTVQTISGNNVGRIQYITNSMSAKQDTSYVLMADLVNYSEKALSSSVLKITGAGIVLDGIMVNGVEYDNDDEINLGTLGIDAFTQISVAFSTNDSGSGSINMIINSATKTELEETISVNVKANKKFELDLIPREVIPYVMNSLFFEATDGNTPLSGVNIEIKSDRDILETVSTNAEGLATYELSAPSAGDELTFTAQKEGYDQVVITKEVDEKIVLIIPPTINETIKIGEVAAFTERVLIENGTVETLKITDVSIEGEVADYLDITIDDVTNETLAADGDLNFNIKFKPNAQAKRLNAPKTVEGKVEIDVEVVSAGQEFAQELPITIRLSMPGYLDSDSCLSISPGTIDFVTSTTEVSQTLTIKNNCAAEGTNVALHNITAKINESSKYGTIFLAGSGFNSISLSDGEVELAEYLESSEEEELTLRFVPTSSAKSGTQTLTLTVDGKNIPDEGEEESVKAKTIIDLTMSDLSECVEIEEPDDGLTLDIAGWNLGYNRIMNSNMSSYAQQYQGFSQNRYGGQSSMPYGMQSSIPFMNSGSGSTAYEENSFIIKNNCALDVEIDLDPDSKLNVSEEEFELAAGDDETITVTPGYTLGNYNIKVNAKVADSEETEEKIDTVSVTVRRLGDVDDDCIKISTSTLEFNSLIYESKKYKVFNYCYNSGLQLSRGANAVTVDCAAQQSQVNPAQSAQYFQTGQQYQGLYQSGYPTNNMTTPNYQSYIGGQDCSSNSCTMVSGTRVYSRTVTGGTETIIFEVMPSAQYVPQRKLFDARTQSYGVFNSIANIRDWATQTDARTRVYGKINVEYSNQYGSTQCKQFPVEIEDMWRIGESIDSLVNWGDTKAKPGECVSKEQRENSLNIQKYWTEKLGAASNGAIPSTEYNDKGNYTFIATPPAVTYGPGSNTSNYPQSSYYQSLNNNNPNKANAKAKNCGFLDSLKNISHTKNVGGVGITVETIGVGSHQRETKGSNFAVTINRNGLNDACVLIRVPVKATLSRAATFESEEITWMLTALVLRKDLNPSDIKDIAKECKTVGDVVIPIDVNDPANQTNDKGNCEVSSKDFGMSRIKEIKADDISKTEYNTYCETKFCNNDMLYYYLENKHTAIDAAITTAKDVMECKDKENTIKDIYKEAKTTPINDTNFYVGSDGKLVILPFTLSESLLENNKTTVDKIKEGPDYEGEATLSWMATLLSNPQIKDQKEIFIAINKVDLANIQTDINMPGVEDTNYLPLETYIAINNTIAKDAYAKCNTEESCTIDLYGTQVLIKADLMKVISEKGQLVRAIAVDLAISEKDKEAIYDKYPKLENIYNLATKGENVYITGVTSFTKPKTDLTQSFTIDHNNVFTKTSLTPGRYDYNIDTKYCQDKEDRKMNITLSDVGMEEKESKAKDNIILQNGFKVFTDPSLEYSTNAVLVSADTAGGAILFARTPVLLTVTASGGAKAIRYHPTNSLTTSNNLITWNGTLADSKGNGNEFVLPLPSPTQPQTYRGIYYYPNSGTLAMTLDQGTGGVTARALMLSSKTLGSQDMSAGKGATIGMSSIALPTLTNVIKWAQEQEKVCITADGQSINWNEAELVK